MLPHPPALDTDATADMEQRPDRLLCRTGTHLWALPLRQVVEVMRALPIVPVSGGPPYVVGLSIIRGAALPVVDIGMMISGEATRIERMVAVRTGDRTVALAAEAVPGIWTAEKQKLGRLPPLLRDVASDVISAIGTLDAELLFLLRDTSIVSEDALPSLQPRGAPA
jgi:purine-binding chemotaxis protein CheW